MGYVCAFRGRRDSYQVPIALAEAHRLDSFITDHYCGTLGRIASRCLPSRLAESVRKRHDRRLPVNCIKRLRLTAASEMTARLVGMSASRIYQRFDPAYGQAAADEARRRKSDLFMYSSYAWEAFRSSYQHTPRKVLFQFHPHHALETAVLERDRDTAASLGIAFAGQLENFAGGEAMPRQRGDMAWRFADHVICASSFTKRSLVEAGAEPSTISVIPYGVSAISEGGERAQQNAGDGTFRALFVGSGLQRKGLHHLLLAWRRARLPAGACLTIVSRVLDPGLEQYVRGTKGVNLVRGVTGAELGRLYRTASVFIMPSLVEGFGQVYLEALSYGLPVIGTRNSCLPDLGNEKDGVFVTAAGDLDELSCLIEIFAEKHLDDLDLRRRATACARKFTWEKFRVGIRESL